jgi:alpha-tubulin suppressor-like RCC1 family protein
VWIRRIAMGALLAAVVVATAWAYRTVRRSRVPGLVTEEPIAAPAQPTAESPEMTPQAAQKEQTYRVGLTPLPDSMLSGPVGSSVTLTTRAMGPDGAPLAGRVVRFRVTSGSGTLGTDSVITDGQGLAQTALALPSRPGRLMVSAQLAGNDLPGTRFSVTARSGAPSRVDIAGGDQQQASPGGLLPEPLTVRVTDQAGIPVPNVEVRFQTVGGGGMVAPSRARTDSVGSASTLWRLGDNPGVQHVAALIPQLTDTFLTFTAKAVVNDSTAKSAPEPGAPTEPDASEPVRVTRRSFTVGGNFVCALLGRDLSCRGADDQGQSQDRRSTAFVALAAGVSHGCALTATGEALCWGGNESGQVGDGSRTDRSAPVVVATPARFAMLTAGVSHTCGLAAGGRAFCWGRNINGQLGDGTRDDHLTPQPVSGGQDFATLVAGWNYTCGLNDRGDVYCWGLNDHGQLGDGTQLDRLTPTRVPGTFESLAAGNAHTCGIRRGEVLCWGDNAFGQLGDGSTQDHARPQPVKGLPGAATELAAGAVSTCALLTDGTAYCWGQNLHGELGDGTHENRSTPSPVAGGLKFRSIFAGGALTCGFTDGGIQYCWGLNQSGQLGDGTLVSRSVPTRVRG